MSRNQQIAKMIGRKNSGHTQSDNQNMIINGAMHVAQRLTQGTTYVDSTTASLYAIDRFNFAGNPTDTMRISQSTDTPGGAFGYSLLMTSKAATTFTGTQYAMIGQRVEAKNIAHVGFGTAAAQPLVCSFYIKCSVTGSIPFVILNHDDTQIFTANCTINTANTWEYKTISIPARTTGTWNGAGSTAIGLKVQWYTGLGPDHSDAGAGTDGGWNTSYDYGLSGHINVCSTNAATLYITGLQLQVGTQATAFQHRTFGEERQTCQRYYQRYSNFANYAGLAMGSNWSVTNGNCPFFLESAMRAAPGVEYSNLAHFSLGGRFSAGGSGAPTGLHNDGYSGGNNLDLGYVRSGGGMTVTSIYLLEFVNSTAGISWLAFNSEL